MQPALLGELPAAMRNSYSYKVATTGVGGFPSLASRGLQCSSTVTESRGIAAQKAAAMAVNGQQPGAPDMSCSAGSQQAGLHKTGSRETLSNPTATHPTRPSPVLRWHRGIPLEQAPCNNSDWRVQVPWPPNVGSTFAAQNHAACSNMK